MKVLNQIIITCFLMSLISSGIAQSHELGKVTIGELNEKEHFSEKEAPAAFLFNIGKTQIEFNSSKGFELVTEIDAKIKIYKKEGLHLANISIPFYLNGAERETVAISKAVTYNMVDGKIEKTKLKSEGEFIEKTNKFWNTKKVTMPSVKEGSIIEYRYTIRSPFLSNFPDWEFQKTIPVNYSKFTSSLTEYYVYNSRIKGYLSPKKTVTSKNTNNYYTVKDRDYVAPVRGSSDVTNKVLNYNEEVLIFELENIPSLIEEEYVNSMNNYQSSISYELAYIKFPNEPAKAFSVSWEDVAKTIYESDSFGVELKKSGYFEDDLKYLNLSQLNNDEKIQLIFDFVKNKVKWNGYYGIYCDEGVRSAYKNNVGNVAEVNIILTAMLREAGFNANPVLVSTRANGIPLYPSRNSFNYVLCAVESNEGYSLLDATETNGTINILPIRDLNWEGRLIRKDGTSSAINLYPSKVSKENYLALVSIDNEGNVNGKIRTQLFDYNAFVFRDKYYKIKKEEYIESLEKKLSNAVITDYNVNNNNDLIKPIVEDFSFKHSELIEIIGERMYFSPLLFYTMYENPFKLEKRDYPVDFIFPYEKKYSFTIEIPDGYSVESLPENAAFMMENNMIYCRYNNQLVGKKIQIAMIFGVNQSIILPDYYNDLKNFFKKSVEVQSNKIVLKKI